MKRSHESPSPEGNTPSQTSGNTSGAASTGRDESGFLGRWSRRKRGAEVLEEEVSEDLLSDSPDTDATHPINTEEGNITRPVADGIDAESLPEAPLTDADMPDVETLNADSDFSPFFSDGVSKELRNAALKKLFFSGKFSTRDGLDDYDDDFTKFEPLGDTVTSDMKFHARRKEKARLAELEEQRLLQERKEAEAASAEASAEDSREDAAIDSTTEDNSTAGDSKQDLAKEDLKEICAPNFIKDESSDDLLTGDVNDENTVPVASEDVEDTMRPQTGKV